MLLIHNKKFRWFVAFCKNKCKGLEESDENWTANCYAKEIGLYLLSKKKSFWRILRERLDKIAL